MPLPAISNIFAHSPPASFLTFDSLNRSIPHLLLVSLMGLFWVPQTLYTLSIAPREGTVPLVVTPSPSALSSTSRPMSTSNPASASVSPEPSPSPSSGYVRRILHIQRSTTKYMCSMLCVTGTCAHDRHLADPNNSAKFERDTVAIPLVFVTTKRPLSPPMESVPMPLFDTHVSKSSVFAFCRLSRRLCYDYVLIRHRRILHFVLSRLQGKRSRFSSR